MDNDGWYTTDVTIGLRSADKISGVNKTYYRLDNGGWSLYSNEIVVVSGQIHTIEFYSVDFAGNTEEIHTISFRIKKQETQNEIGEKMYIISGIIFLSLIPLIIFSTVRIKKKKGMSQKNKPSNDNKENTIQRNSSESLNLIRDPSPKQLEGNNYEQMTKRQLMEECEKKGLKVNWWTCDKKHLTKLLLKDDGQRRDKATLETYRKQQSGANFQPVQDGKNPIPQQSSPPRSTFQPALNLPMPSQPSLPGNSYENQPYTQEPINHLFQSFTFEIEKPWTCGLCGFSVDGRFKFCVKCGTQRSN